MNSIPVRKPLDGRSDPFGMPQAVIVSTLRLASYVARGDVQLHKRLSSFTRGLSRLQQGVAQSL